MPSDCFASQEPACGGFVCDTDARLCLTSCAGNHHCSSGFTCDDQQRCVQAKSLPNGSSCEQAADCASRLCCGNGINTCRSGCLEVGAACTASDECLSNYCCMSQGTRICSANACLLSACVSDSDCGSGWCVAGKCERTPRSNGESCLADKWCSSGTCHAGICRGLGVLGNECSSDYDCSVGRACCAARASSTTKTCTAVDLGCSGAVGDNCSPGMAVCLSGSYCVESILCTKACTKDSDCGVGAWGSNSFCAQNGLGNRMCFPGCEGRVECQANLGASFECVATTSTSGHATQVCAGNVTAPYELRVD